MHMTNFHRISTLILLLISRSKALDFWTSLLLAIETEMRQAYLLNEASNK